MANFRGKPNALPSINQPSVKSIDLDLTEAGPSSTFESRLLPQPEKDAAALSQQNLTSHEYKIASSSSEQPTERIKSWIEDVPKSSVLLQMGGLVTGRNKNLPPVVQKGSGKTAGKGVPQFEVKVDDSDEDESDGEEEPLGMSIQGRYMAIPKTKTALSKLGIEVVARKLSLQIAQTVEGRTMGSGVPQKSLMDMVKHRKANLPMSSDSYVQLMNSRSLTRSGSVPSASSRITIAASEATDDQPTSSMSGASGATGMTGMSAASSIKKTLGNKGNLNFKALTNLRLMSKRAMKNVNAVEKFAKDVTHLKYLREMGEEVNISIPVPIRISIYTKVLLVLNDTIKAYKSKLGPKHPLTNQAVAKYELFSTHLGSMIKTMG